MRNLITSSSWTDPIDIFIPFIDHTILEQISKVLYTGELFSDDIETLKKVQLVLTEFLGFPPTNFEISGQVLHHSLEETNNDNVNVEEESDFQMVYLQWHGSDNCENHQTDEILEETPQVNLFSCVISKKCKETFQSAHDLENHVLNDHITTTLSREDINELLLAKYKGESDRLNTFKGWKYMFISPEKLAKSGFINTGKEDNVQCVFCTGILGNWEENDDPMTEHKKSFPKCCFVHNADGYNVLGNNIPIIAKKHNSNNNPEISTSNMEIFDENIQDINQQKDTVTARDFDGSIKNVNASNFELISEELLEMPENLSSPEFKVTNIDDNPEISTSDMEIFGDNIAVEEENIQDISQQKDITVTARDFDGSIKNVKVSNFELISEEHLEMPENLPSPEEFKVPNIDDNDAAVHVELPDQVNNNGENLNESSDEDDDEKYKCDICKENFETAENLMNHRRLHNASSRWKYSCTFCQNRFQHELGLKKHIFQKHHGCYVCKIDFSSRSMLESHITKTHGGKLYVFRNRKIVMKERSLPSKRCE